MSAKTIAFAPRRKGGDAPLVINADTIRYIQMKRNYAEVHLTNGAVFTSRITMEELEQHLGDDFIRYTEAVWLRCAPYTAWKTPSF